MDDSKEDSSQNASKAASKDQGIQHSILVDQAGGSSFTSSFLAFINTMMGSGLIATPYALRCTGLLLGLILLAIIGLLASFSLYCVAHLTCHFTGSFSFSTIAMEKLPLFSLTIDLIFIFQGFGVCLSYLILMGNSVPPLVIPILQHLGLPDGSWLVENLRSVSIVVLMCFVLFPLSMLRSVRSLKLTFILSILSTLYIAAMVVVFFILHLRTEEVHILPSDPPREPPELWNWNFQSILKGMSIFIFGQTCHQNIFSIYQEMRPPKSKESLVAAGSSGIAFSCVLYSLVSLAGYITLGKGVSSQLFDSYDQKDARTSFSHILDFFDPARISLSIARFILLILVCCAFPLQLFPVRESIKSFCSNISLLKMKLHRNHSILTEDKSISNLADSSFSQEKSPLLGQPDLDTVPKSDSQNDNDKQDVHLVPLQTAKDSHGFISILFCFLATISAIVSTDLGLILTLIGAIGANSTIFLFGPVLFILYYPYRDWQWILAHLLVAFALLFGLSVIISELF